MGKTTTTDRSINFDSVNLSENEINECRLKCGEDLQRNEASRLFYLYVSEGLGQIEASARATKESEKIRVTDEALKPYLDKAKEKRYYDNKVSAYFESIKSPKELKFNQSEYFKYAHGKFTELTGISEITKEFQLLFNYFTGGVCGLDPKKGLLLIGNIGCGKTTIMNVFRDGPNPYRIVSCREVANYWKVNGDISAFSKLHSDNGMGKWSRELIGICFDDLGIENKTKNYGDEVNAMEEVLLNWYDKKKFNKVHLTTNLTPDEIEQKYGKRVRSRMREMFNIVQFEGEDKRK